MPVAVQAEVHLEGVSAREVHELQLRASRDGLHTHAGDLAACAVGERAPLCGVVRLEAHERAAGDRAAQASRGILDFGEFGHGGMMQCALLSHSLPQGYPINSPRSLRHEYELYVEREIEDYKDSVSRSALLKIGDEAVASLCNEAQITLTEIVVWQEVDRIIAKRLRLPSYATWKRRRLRTLEQYRRPEHWGIDPNAALVRALEHAPDRHVLVAGAEGEGPALYLAARGCAVTAIEPAYDAVERVVRAAEAAGLTGRVRGYCADLGAWAPDVRLDAVVCSPAAFAGLSAEDRARVIEVLQSATVDGGVHLVETIAAGADVHGSDAGPDAGSAAPVRVEELESRYRERGWTVSIERATGRAETLLARKAAVA
jgi:hypothetical protein